MASDGRKPFRALSIDGGGIRGLYTISYLSACSRLFARQRGAARLDLGAYFDLIAGTSTGAMIAAALAIGTPLDRIARLYEKEGPKIFPIRVPNGFGVELAKQHFWSRTPALDEGDAALRSALAGEFGSTTIEEVWKSRGIGLAIPAVEMSRYHPHVFKTPHLQDSFNRDGEHTLVDVCLASTAAPIYRKLARIAACEGGDHQVFTDGGLWANDPVMIALIDALDMTEPGDEIEILSIGSNALVGGEVLGAKELTRGFGEWKFGAKVVEASLCSQAFAAQYAAQKLARHLKRDCKIVRFPESPSPASLTEFLGMDDTRAKTLEALVQKGKADASSLLGFMRAEPGSPLHNFFLSAPALDPNDDPLPSHPQAREKAYV